MTCDHLFDAALSLHSVINKNHSVWAGASDFSVRPYLTVARIPVIGRAVRTEYLVDIGGEYCCTR